MREGEIQAVCLPENSPATSTAIAHGVSIRQAGAAELGQALQAMRQHTLAIFAAYETADMLSVPYSQEFNPPLWELGHVGWFQEWWIGRNQQRAAGTLCDPAHLRARCAVPDADHWYNSSTVAHASRWHLPLLQTNDCKAYLATTLEHTLTLLAQAGNSDAELYFYRLMLLHEAMHAEAALYMGQALNVKLAIDLGAVCAYFTGISGQISIKKGLWSLGSAAQGFSFDNELGGHRIALADFQIDARAVSWAQYLPFVEATQRALPRYTRRASDGSYACQVFGQWSPLEPCAAAVHLSYHDAQAYCQWAGRRLPTEAEWECAAMSDHPELAQGAALRPFHWGEVWEWTASTFAPYPGFVPHPYRDYSEPWFHTRQVLRGACTATHSVMRNPKYRNYFTPERTDIYAGFRTCAL